MVPESVDQYDSANINVMQTKMVLFIPWKALILCIFIMKIKAKKNPKIITWMYGILIIMQVDSGYKGE